MLPQARPPSEEAYHVRPDMRRSADAVSDKSVVYNLLFSVYAFPECPVQPKESGYKNNYLASHGLHVLSEQDQERGINYVCIPSGNYPHARRPHLRHPPL
jgi:hypothetical protein